MWVPSKADGFCSQVSRLKAQWYSWNLWLHGKEVKLGMLTRKVEIRPEPSAKQVHFNSPSSLHIYLIQLPSFYHFENALLVPAAKLLYQKRGKKCTWSEISCKTSLSYFMPSGSCQKCWECSSTWEGLKTKFLRKETGQILQLQLLHTPSQSELPLCGCDQAAPEHNRQQGIMGAYELSLSSMYLWLMTDFSHKLWCFFSHAD